MKITVLGGSPKGAKSVTMQYVEYMKGSEPGHEFTEHQIAANIRKIETDNTLLQSILEDIRNADAVLWAFPLYFGLVHGSYKRFIELLWERDVTDVFSGKHCAILATSIHFFDHTAVTYIRDISEDLGMVVDEVHSAGMGDLMEPEGRRQCGLFMDQWMKKVRENVQSSRLSVPVTESPAAFVFDESSPCMPRTGVKLGLVTESGVSESLDHMVRAMTREFTDAKVFDLSGMKIAGGCLGCLKCGYENKCVYDGRDDVIDTYRALQNCDVLIFAGAIRDRYLSSRWKTFTDRMFFTTHIPFLDKKLLGFLVSGPLSQIPNLQNLLTGFYETDGMRIGGIVTDEGEDTAKRIRDFASTLESYHKSGYQPPRQFPGEAGHRIFRDEIFGGLRGVFVADHKYYKKNGLYDFPQKQRKKRLSAAFMNLAMKLPSVRKEIQTNMVDYMIKPYESALKR